MGAGILPISFNGVCMVFLLGKEHNNEWSDFGGTSLYKHETKFKTAIREGHEEAAKVALQLICLSNVHHTRRRSEALVGDR